jgi:dCTP deaminase
MILNDRMIREWAAKGGITPFDTALVNPASLDLRLGNQIREPHEIWSRLSVIDLRHKIADGTIEQLPTWGEPFDFTKYWLMPHGKGANFILCSSLEFVNIPDDMAALLFSKSSTGRRGVEHLHAGYGDPGWHDSQWTWEIHNVAPWPIPLYAGKPLMQQVMIRMADAPERTYAETGRYNNQSGPTPERPEVSR